MVAGFHDSRNQRLHDALGIKLIGHVPNAFRAELASSPLGLTGTMDLLAGDKALRLARLSAQSLATYQLSGPARDSNDHHDCDDEDKRYRLNNNEARDDDRSDHQDECQGHPERYVDAVTFNNYGQGKALFAGFDLLAEATKEGANGLPAKTLLAALAITHPAPIKTALGAVVPIKLTLQNQGVATDATVTVAIPNGAVVNQSGGGVLRTTPQGQTLTFSVSLALAQEKGVTFYLRLPMSAGTGTLNATIEAGNRLITQVALNLTVTAIRVLDDLKAQATSLATGANAKALNAAAADLGKAITAKTIDKAIGYGLNATDDLLGISDPAVVELRRGIDEWIRYTWALMN